MNSRNHTLAFKLNIKKYLRELEQLSITPPSEDSLLSLEATKLLRDRAKHIKAEGTASTEIKFGELSGVHFSNFLKKLHAANGRPIYIWTGRTNDCGAFAVDSILHVNFNFPFNVNDEGIISFLTEDCADVMFLDFSLDEKTGDPVVEVETSGEHWSKVTLEARQLKDSD